MGCSPLGLTGIDRRSVNYLYVCRSNWLRNPRGLQILPVEEYIVESKDNKYIEILLLVFLFAATAIIGVSTVWDIFP